MPSDRDTSSREASRLTMGHSKLFDLSHLQHQLLQQPRPSAQGSPESWGDSNTHSLAVSPLPFHTIQAVQTGEKPLGSRE